MYIYVYNIPPLEGIYSFNLLFFYILVKPYFKGYCRDINVIHCTLCMYISLMFDVSTVVG